MKTKHFFNMRILLPLALIMLVLPLEADVTDEIHWPVGHEFFHGYMNIPVLLFKGLKIFEKLRSVWNYVLQHPDSNILDAFSKGGHVSHGFNEISSKLDTLQGEVTHMAVSVQNLLETFPQIVKLELNLHELTSIINQINFVYYQMQEYMNSTGQNPKAREKLIPNVNVRGEFFETENDGRIFNATGLREMSNEIMKKRSANYQIEKSTWENFAVWATGLEYNSLQSLLRRMNDVVAPKQSESLFDMIYETSQEMNSNVCNLRQSPHQTFYNLYNTIALAELKGNVILQFSYMILKMYEKGDFAKEAAIAQSNYESYTKQKLEAIQDALSKADRSVYRCDPKQFVEGVSYTRLTKLLQGYIENEVNLNPYGTCRENCQYYTYTEYNGCFKNQFCANQPPCRGKVLECRYVDSDMNICTSSNPDRRYDWIEYENGRILGDKGVCQNKNFFKVDSWWRYLFWHCSYCLCLCDDANRGSDRYFNLREVTSDIKENKIVTGLRIVKENKVIHLQIQQGVLQSLGFINKTSLAWKPVDSYSIDDDNVQNNVDYHTMTWLERAIDTDEVYGPPEHVVTGVRFRKIGTHLNLEVRVTPINFTTGDVFDDQHSYWLGNDNTDASQKNPRREIHLRNPDIPIRNGPHSLNSNHNEFIQFQATSFEKDAGQSTVPFLDSQVITSQGFPLSGVGLIHRGKEGSGGFLALKLISYDFAPHLDVDKRQ